MICEPTNLELALVEGAHRGLVSGMTHVHKHHDPGLLLGGGKVLFVDAIRKCHYKIIKD